MNKRHRLIILLVLSWLCVVGCASKHESRWLIVSEAVHFGVQPGSGSLNLPVFAGTLDMDNIVHDVSQAEYYHQKFAAVYGGKSLYFIADSGYESTSSTWPNLSLVNSLCTDMRANQRGLNSISSRSMVLWRNMLSGSATKRPVKSATITSPFLSVSRRLSGCCLTANAIEDISLLFLFRPLKFSTSFR